MTEHEKLAAQMHKDAMALLSPKQGKPDFLNGRELLRQAVLMGSMKALTDWHLLRNHGGPKRG